LQIIIWAALVLVLDQFSKYFVQQFMAEGESIPVIPGIFHITLYKNPGAAFGIFAHQTTFFIFITIVVMALIIYFYFQIPKNRVLARIALALQFGGAAGNLIDRLLKGYVVDFIDFRIWPVFNLADSAIVVGVIFLSWEILRWREEERCEQED